MLSAALERCGHGEAEGFSRFQESVGGAKGRARQAIGVVASGQVLTGRGPRVRTGEHAAVDLYGRRRAAIEAQGVVGKVNAEGRIDDRKHGLQFEPGGHTHSPVGARNRAEVLRDVADGVAAGTRIRRLGAEDRAAEQRALQGFVLDRVDLQLRSTQDRIDARIDKGRDGDWPGNGNAVFKVAVQTEVAAGSYELIIWNRDIPAVVDARSRGVDSHRKARVGGNESCILVPEGHNLRAGQVGDGRGSTDIEPAQIVFASEVGSFKWRRDHPIIARDKRSLQVVTNGVAAFLNGEKLFVLDDGPDGVNRATESSDLTADEQAPAMVGRVGGIERVHAEAGGDLAGDDAAERVGAGDAPEVEILEQELGSVADGNQRRAVEGVADAKALEGTAQRVA